jgi:hypothetical protein
VRARLSAGTILVIVLGVLVFGIGIAALVLLRESDDPGPTPGSGGETTAPVSVAPTTETTPPEPVITYVSALDLPVGACFILNSNPPGATGVQEVPCDQPHDAQVTATSLISDDDVPVYDQAALSAYTDPICDQAATDYVGRYYTYINVFHGAQVPDAEGWAAGDRRLVCDIYTLSGRPILTRSAEGQCDLYGGCE